jgi:hypothetical protein
MWKALAIASEPAAHAVHVAAPYVMSLDVMTFTRHKDFLRVGFGGRVTKGGEVLTSLVIRDAVDEDGHPDVTDDGRTWVVLSGVREVCGEVAPVDGTMTNDADVLRAKVRTIVRDTVAALMKADGVDVNDTLPSPTH